MGSGLCFTLSSLVLHKIIQSIFATIVEQAPLAIEDLMNELDTQSGEGEASAVDGGDSDDGDSDNGDSDDGDSDDGDSDDGDSDDGDSDESSEGEQDLQDTPPKALPAGEEPRPVLGPCWIVAAVSWLFSPEPRMVCHEVRLVYSPKSVSALDSHLPARFLECSHLRL